MEVNGMAGLYGISAYQQTSQAYSKSTVNNDTKTQSTAKSDQTAATIKYSFSRS
jgi:hypothetical protein